MDIVMHNNKHTKQKYNAKERNSIVRVVANTQDAKWNDKRRAKWWERELFFEERTKVDT